MRTPTEPEKWAERHCRWIESDPDDAAAGFSRERDVHADFLCSRIFVTRLELHMAKHAIAFQNKIIASPIDLRAQHLDVASASAPKKAQQLSDEQMLDDLLAKARVYPVAL